MPAVSGLKGLACPTVPKPPFDAKAQFSRLSNRPSGALCHPPHPLNVAADIYASSKIPTSREALIEAFERRRPDLLPLMRMHRATIKTSAMTPTPILRSHRRRAQAAAVGPDSARRERGVQCPEITKPGGLHDAPGLSGFLPPKRFDARHL